MGNFDIIKTSPDVKEIAEEIFSDLQKLVRNNAFSQLGKDQSMSDSRYQEKQIQSMLSSLRSFLREPERYDRDLLLRTLGLRGVMIESRQVRNANKVGEKVDVLYRIVKQSKK